MKRFRQLFAASDPSGATAPGRVNLIGEHTDYNEGFVLPMGIDLHVAVAFAPNGDRSINVHSTADDATRRIDIDTLSAPGGAEWYDYVAAVAWALAEDGEEPAGVDMVVCGNVPIGAGLASSAALEMAVTRALCHASGIDWEPSRMALLGQRGENEFVGVSCGIMDQFAAAASRAGCAMLLDCRNLETAAVAIPDEATFVVMDTGVRRKLSHSEYNDRRASCERAVAVLAENDRSVLSLRDVNGAALAAREHLMDSTTYKRARHVVAENRRPAEMADHLRNGDLAGAGRVMNESHASLRDLYEVSSAELDAVTAAAREAPGCFGARMTGAGFGGCAVALVDSRSTREFVAEVRRGYSATSGMQGNFHVCAASAGASLI
jgi:galactokinase